VPVSNLGVTLPAGFSYRHGSTTGAVTVDPQVGGAGSQTLTWAGPINVPAGGTTSLHFGANASANPGAYSTTVQANVDAPFSVAVASAGAPVTVVAAGGSGSSGGGGSSSSGGSSTDTTTTSTTTTTTTTDPATVPPPAFEQSADVEPVSGEVLVRSAGTTDFVPLTSATQVGFGSEIDASNGRVEVTTVDSQGTLYHADFYEGRFLIRNQLENGITVLQLSGSDFSVCKKATKRTLAAADKNPKEKKAKKGKKSKKKVKQSKRVVRHLWASGTGKFRTRGRYIAATVHGTTWLTQDRCDGTRAYVQEGVVDVRDLVKHKTIRLGAGQSYLARKR
jgi:hypothetical protein